MPKLAAFGTAFLLATMARASPQDALREARVAIEEQRYDDAVATLAPIVAAGRHADRAQALSLTAIAHLVVGRMAEGRAAVADLYALAPAWALDDASLPPRVTDVFTAEAAEPHPRSVTIALRPREGASLELVASGSSSVALACRAGAAAFAPVATRREGDRYRFELPTAQPHRCWAIARDADGLPLGRLGSPSSPFEAKPAPPPKPTPLTGRWWFWTGIGLAAASAATIAIAVGSSGPAQPPDADLTVTATRFAIPDGGRAAR